MRECVKRAVPDISAARLAAVAADQDSLDEVSQQDALKLRLVMERAQKLSAALSNLLKKASDTSESTVSNLK
jgi:hypothetical protein